MAYTYIISDIRFNDFDAAKKDFILIEDYNDFRINKWNSVVNEDDTVLIFGKFGCGDMKSIINKLNGTIIIADSDDNQNYSINEWKNMGVKYVLKRNAFHTYGDNKTAYFTPIKLDDNDDSIIFTTEKDNLGQVFKGNRLSIEAKYWDYTPIKLDELGDIIERMREYADMEE